MYNKRPKTLRWEQDDHCRSLQNQIVGGKIGYCVSHRGGCQQRNMSGLVGGMWWKIEFKRRKFELAFVTNCEGISPLGYW